MLYTVYGTDYYFMIVEVNVGGITMNKDNYTSDTFKDITFTITGTDS